MAWGQRKDKPFTADYSRQFDTHTSGRTDAANMSNDPSRSDLPEQGFGVREGASAPMYRVPNRGLLDTSHEIGPREIATGNAPSGGYSTLPGNGWAQPGILGNRSYRVTEDFEAGQNIVAAQRDLTKMEQRQNAQVREDLATPKPNPASAPVRAVTHSPYEQEWPEPDRLTNRLNPNPYRMTKDWDNQGEEYRGSGARYLNGQRFSFATHQTLNPYEGQVDGMAPTRQGRNTYRVDPAPWDGTVTDSPANGQYSTAIDRSSDGDAVSGLGRSYRL